MKKIRNLLLVVMLVLMIFTCFSFVGHQSNPNILRQWIWVKRIFHGSQSQFDD